MYLYLCTNIQDSYRRDASPFSVSQSPEIKALRWISSEFCIIVRRRGDEAVRKYALGRTDKGVIFFKMHLLDYPQGQLFNGLADIF